MAEDIDTRLYDEHPSCLAHAIEAYRLTVTNARPLLAVLTMTTKDGMRCDTLLTQDDARQIASTLASFADLTRDNRSIRAAVDHQELDAVVPYGTH